MPESGRTEASEEANDWINLGCDAFDKGDHSSAESYFRRAAELGAPIAFHNLGNTLREQGRFEAAANAFRRAVEAGVDDSLRNLGQMEERLGDNAAARAAYDSAVSRGDGEARFPLAQMDEAEGDFARAEQHYREMELEGDERALADHVEFLGRQLRLDEARVLIEGFVGSSTEPLLVLARSLRKSGDTDGAREILEALAVRDVEAALLPLGNLLWDEYDDIEGAERAYRLALRCGDANASFNLGLLLTRLGRRAEGIRLIRGAAARGDSYAVRWLAEEDVQQG